MKKFYIIIIVLLFAIPAVLYPFGGISKPNVVRAYSGNDKGAIIFIPGLGLQAQDYTMLLSHFNEEGYSLIEYIPKEKKTDNYQEMVTDWTQDIKKLAGNKKVIVIGHSVGGAVAAHFCSIDKRCIAGVNMDGTPAFYEKIPVPFLYLQADVGRYCDQQCLHGRSVMEQITKDSQTEKIQLPGMKHYNFTDDALGYNLYLRAEDYLGSIDGKEGLVNVTVLLGNFLNHVYEK